MLLTPLCISDFPLNYMAGWSLNELHSIDKLD